MSGDNNILLKLDNDLKDSPDIIKKKVIIDDNEAYFIYIEGLVDKDLLQRDFIRPIIGLSLSQLKEEKYILNLPGLNVSIIYDMDNILLHIMSGEALFICNKLSFIVSCKEIKYDKRQIESPIVEKNLRGPNEGFIESLSTNLSILRRKIKNNRLKFKIIKIGTITNQVVNIAYIDGLTNTDILNTLYEKIKSINFDGLSAIGYIEQAIISRPNSIFPQFQVTERPDKAVAALLEGRLVILLDGTPVVLIAPVSFFPFFKLLMILVIIGFMEPF